MEETIRQLLRSQLRHADIDAVLDLVRYQLQHNPAWAGYARGERLGGMVRTELIQDCEWVAEFCATGTTEDRRAELLQELRDGFEEEVRCKAREEGTQQGLTAAEHENVAEQTLSSFFQLENLDQVLREDSLPVRASDLIDVAAICGWLDSDSPLAGFLVERGRKNAKADPGGEPFLDRSQPNSVTRLLELLNGVVNDPESWPKSMLDLVIVQPATEAAAAEASHGGWHRRRYHRLLLNDIFPGALRPRMGYSPRLGSFRRYVRIRLFQSRLRDAMRKRIRQLKRGLASPEDARNAYPLLNPEDIGDPVGFAAALGDPRSAGSQAWMAVVAESDPALAELCRSIGGGLRGLPVDAVRLVECLNAVMGTGRILELSDAEDSRLPLALRVFLGTHGRTYAVSGRSRALFNRRCLEILYGSWIPTAPPVQPSNAPEDRDGMEEEAQPGEVFDDPYRRAVLDLLLKARIAPDSMGAATLRGLSWFGSREGQQDPSVLPELLRWFRLEHQDALSLHSRTTDKLSAAIRKLEALEDEVARHEAGLDAIPDQVVLEVLGRIDPGLRLPVHLSGSDLRERLLKEASEVPLGWLDELLEAAEAENNGRGNAPVCQVLRYAGGSIRRTKARGHKHEIEGDLLNYRLHRGPHWIRSQQDVGGYLGRGQTDICRQLGRVFDDRTLLQHGAEFADLRARNIPFPNEDGDPVGPRRAARTGLGKGGVANP